MVTLTMSASFLTSIAVTAEADRMLEDAWSLPARLMDTSAVTSAVAPIEGTATGKLTAAKAERIRNVVDGCLCMCVILGPLSDEEA